MAREHPAEHDEVRAGAERLGYQSNRHSQNASVSQPATQSASQSVIQSVTQSVSQGTTIHHFKRARAPCPEQPSNEGLALATSPGQVQPPSPTTRPLSPWAASAHSMMAESCLCVRFVLFCLFCLFVCFLKRSCVYIYII